MLTYQIQYLTDGKWVTYQDDNHFAVELLSLGTAQSVARDLSQLETHPSDPFSWKIVDSKGNIFEI